jgi:hypothetical protein
MKAKSSILKEATAALENKRKSEAPENQVLIDLERFWRRFADDYADEETDDKDAGEGTGEDDDVSCRIIFAGTRSAYK